MGVCVLDGVIAVAVGWGISAIGCRGAVGVGVCILSSVVTDLGGIATIAVGWPDRLSRVWFNLSCSALVASGSANSLMVAMISLFVY